MPGPYKRERFVRPPDIAGLFLRKYAERYPPALYETQVESWQRLSSGKFEIIMKRLEFSKL
jgi:hypothetical protein